jgi:hypothetical protein
VLTGPRQSGKTTLVRALFSDRAYANLELPDVRERAIRDPRGFLAGFPTGAVIDEVQRAPDLFSHIQGDVDGKREQGRWILVGSQNLMLLSAVSQSLAGRAALFELLPLSLAELRAAGWAQPDLFETLWKGGYPAPFDRNESPYDWYASYVATYVERDVRQVLGVTNLRAFQSFLRLAASRTAQLLNLSQLGAEAGITHNTARSWLSVLETTYVVQRVAPYAKTIGKRLVKTPKLHFLDTGLACYLLGIRTPDELRLHPLHGPLFESWVTSEVLKAYRNCGMTPLVFHLRDTHGLEVDLVIERGADVLGIEVKSGATVPMESFAPLLKVSALLSMRERYIVHSGTESFSTSQGQALAFSDLHTVEWT